MIRAFAYNIKSIFILLFLFSSGLPVCAEDGYDTWLRYKPVSDPVLAAEYIKYCGEIYVYGESDIISSSVNELTTGFRYMLGIKPGIKKKEKQAGIVIGVAGMIKQGSLVFSEAMIQNLNNEGYLIKSTDTQVFIISKSETGLLYGTFHLLRLMQMNVPFSDLDIFENPGIRLRLLNHWDNPGKVPDGQPPVERGYSGGSIFKWQDLPALNNRYTDYARMLASIGINGTVINNVNTAKNGLEGWKLLTPEYLPKLKSLADLFRKYGIRLFISVNFFSPVLISGLDNADPLNPEVSQWWKIKAAEIYSAIPDFGGFLVKADSEGEPGPMKYGRTHAEGANMLAEALEPFGGIAIWRAFVYGKDKNLSDDRACQAYEVFKPLDGKFSTNALVQIKNGPIDFQVREPVSSLFGSMPETNQVLEIQITQEYTGQDKHICYLVPQWKEILDFDTYAKGPGSTVARVVGGDLFGYRYSGVAGVSNIGDDTNWTGHLFAQANLYGFGRLLWNPGLPAEEITGEWITRTFGKDKMLAKVISDILLSSWKTYEMYTSPLGVGLMCDGGHFLPNPAGRGNYHKADREGVGFDRTLATGSGYTGQYNAPVNSMFENLTSCPDEQLLFFHHVPYTYVLKSGKTVIQHIYDTHNEGVERVKDYLFKWQSLEGLIDSDRFGHVMERIRQQVVYAEEWRNSLNSYFTKLSGIEDRNE